MSDPIATLREHLAPISDLQRAAAVLGWDQQTYMPRGGAAGRGEQLATLSRIAHEMFTAERTAELLAAAEDAAATLPADDDGAALVRITRRDLERSRKLPSEFVAEWARTRAHAHGSWVAARQASNFQQFAPDLAAMFRLARQQADYLGYADHPYDALLDAYEPDLRSADVSALFAQLRAGLRPLVALAQANAPAVDASPLQRGFPAPAQLAFTEHLLAAIGYDFQRGRQDLAPHPFCTSFGVGDVRVTTRVSEGELNQALFGSLHEMGHGLYEQGVAPELSRTRLGSGASLGIHESQSRMWENLIGRGRPFWEHFYGQLQAAFPSQLHDVAREQFYRAINRASPSFIRVEADELTYNFHIMLRYDLEQRLLTGELQTDEVPEAWNAWMEENLGITPPNDALGCLQDVHWSSGLIGYFPTYTLGNVISAQFYAAAKVALPELEEQIRAGEFGPLLGWLRENIHRHGRKWTPNELIARVTGGGLAAEPYLMYLTQKYQELYQS